MSFEIRGLRLIKLALFLKDKKGHELIYLEHQDLLLIKKSCELRRSMRINQLWY